MNIEPFIFSKTPSKLSIYQHLCYYHNMANDNFIIIDEDKQNALLNFKKIYQILGKEYKEYSKVRNSDYILSSGLYAQYVGNIIDAYAHCLKVNSYENLSSNLYNIRDYMTYEFPELFCLDESNIFNEKEVNKFLHKICCIEQKNGNVYVGKVDIKICDVVDNKDESVSVFFLDEWIQINIDDIEKISIMDI